MKLYSTQTKNVLDIIKNEGVYYANSIFSNYYHRINLINNLIEKSNIHLDCMPVWCWYKIEGKHPLYDTCTFFDLLPYEAGKYVTLELEVPDSLVHLSNYFNWCDYLSSNDDNDVFYIKKSYDKLLDFDANKDTIQALIPCIKKEYVIRILDTDILYQRSIKIQEYFDNQYYNSIKL